MSDMPWFQFYPNDWLAGTRGLSAVETGVYITIIATLYDRAAPLPNDPDRLARMCGASKRIFVAALNRLVEDGKLMLTERGIWNERVEEELQNRNEKVERNKKAAETRWSGKSELNQQQPDAPALQPQSQSDAISEVRSQKSEREREDAHAQDPKHWVEVQGHLKDRLPELTDWEVDCLHSVKWSLNLTKAQSASLKAISDKLKSTERIGGEALQVKKGTPEFISWIAYKKSEGLKTAFLESQDAITVPSTWPPQHTQAAA